MSRDRKLATATLLILAGLLLPLLIITGLLFPVERLSAAPDIGFRVSPTYINPTVAAGDDTRETVTLQNISGDQIVVHANTGSDPDQAHMTVSMDSEQVSLNPGESSDVSIIIKVQDETPSGRYQQQILFDASPSSGRDVAIIGRVAMGLDVSVIHPVDNVSWSFPRLVDSSEQVSFIAQGQNMGNYTTSLIEKIELSGILGAKVDLRAASEPVAIGETAHLQAIWDEAPLFSIKKTTLSVGSGVGAPVKDSAFLVVFPWKLSLMILMMAAIAAAGARFQPFFAKVFAANGRKPD